MGGRMVGGRASGASPPAPEPLAPARKPCQNRKSRRNAGSSVCRNPIVQFCARNLRGTQARQFTLRRQAKLRCKCRAVKCTASVCKYTGYITLHHEAPTDSAEEADFLASWEIIDGLPQNIDNDLIPARRRRIWPKLLPVAAERPRRGIRWGGRFNQPRHSREPMILATSGLPGW